MKKSNTKGFTLIELLVVITIIGILATGATAVYSSAQQKARDSVRQSDIMALKSAFEQGYSDDASYPQATAAAVTAAIVTTGYIADIPDDPKDGEDDGTTTFQYMYGATEDGSNIPGQEYELSAAFENGSAATLAKETADGGSDAARWEIGSDGTIDTEIDESQALNAAANVYDDSNTEQALALD